jgi:glycosyltransferase involved in cell wall biosynthesis
MNIGFLTPEYPHAKTCTSGGLGTSIYNLAKALTLDSVKITVFLYGQSQDEMFFDEDVRVIRIKNIKQKGFSWLFTRKKIQSVINRYIRTDQIDIVEVGDWTGISAWIKLDSPVIMRLHGSDTYFCDLDKRPVKLWNKLQEKIAFLQADFVLAVSDFVGKQTNRVFAAEREYTVIPNSVNPDYFCVLEEKSPKENNILYFGTLIKKKGAFDIPRIFNQLHLLNPNARLVLVGGDSADIESGNISTWSLMQPIFDEETIEKVHYLGKIRYDQVKQVIAEASVCIFPSYAEALPVSWLEAMSMGKAIVASNIGWANEMITEGEDGFLVHPSDHSKFALQINKLLQDGNLNNKMGQNARQTVIDKFSSEKLRRDNINFYKQVIDDKSKRI